MIFYCISQYVSDSQVPLGVILKNEAHLGEMCNILGDLSKYVPSNCGYAEEHLSQVMHPSQCQIMQLLLFGDQLTVERARGAMVLRSLHEHAINRLEGFVPVIADWHARMTLVKVNCSTVRKLFIVLFAGCLGPIVFHKIFM